MMKRCGNCGKYPFCEKMVDINGCCCEWNELIGLCRNCLGCNRLEDKNFIGTYRCEYWKEN